MNQPVVDTYLCFLCISLRSLGIEQAEMLMSLWDIEGLVSQPFMFMEALRQIRVEGVKVPNDRRFLQAMLQVRAGVPRALTS